MLRNPFTLLNHGRKQFIASLWQGERNVLSIVYDELLHTARLESDGIKRLFMLYKEGKRHPKIVFKNEYGFDIGAIVPSVDEKGFGKMEMLGNKYVYHLPQKDSDALTVHNSADEQPLAVITAEASNGQPNKLSLDNLYRLLMCICWHLQLPARSNEKFKSVLNTSPQYINR